MSSKILNNSEYADGIVKDEKFHLIGHSYDDYKYWVDGVAQQFAKDVDYLYELTGWCKVCRQNRSDQEISFWKLKDPLDW